MIAATLQKKYSQPHCEDIKWIESELKSSFSKGKKFNAQHIALLLRIADYIDFDSQRAPHFLFEQKNLSGYSLQEWQKHATICNIEKFDRTKHELYFEIECTDFDIFCLISDTVEDIQRELIDSLNLAKKFTEKKYLLKIKDRIRLDIRALGFDTKRFQFTIDYAKISELLMGENIYGNKKYGLREIIQNSFDACRMMQEVNNRDKPYEPYRPQVTIIFDRMNDWVIIKDNGTGMSENIINQHFLTIGSSYYSTDEFLGAAYKFVPHGTFGIGFLSSFMLSNVVKIDTKHYQQEKPVCLRIKRNSKYICFEDTSFSGYHGTDIYLQYQSLMQVFENEQKLAEFLKYNFFEFDADVVSYKRVNDKFIDKQSVKKTALKSAYPIDLSMYLNGIDCFADILTLSEYETSHNYDFSNLSGDAVFLFFGKNQRIMKLDYPSDLNCKYICTIINSTAAFEDLLEELDLDDNIDELIEYFEQYGYDCFDKNFDKFNYEAPYYENRWISKDVYNISVCFVWDNCYSADYINECVSNAQNRYFTDNEIFAINKDENEVQLIASDIDKTDSEYIENAFLRTGNCSTQFILDTHIYYRGVFLNEARIAIPEVLNIFTKISLVMNIMHSKVMPNVSRSNIMEDYVMQIEYALGRAVHFYLLEYYKNDLRFYSAISEYISGKYSNKNEFCKGIF